VEPRLGHGFGQERLCEQAIRFAGRVHQQEFARRDRALKERFILFHKSVLMNRRKAITLGIVQVKHGAVHADEDRHDAHDGAEDLFEVAQTHHGLRHLQ